MTDHSVPRNWLRSPLGNLLKTIVGGGTPPKNVPEYFQGSIPLMTVKDMKVRRPSKTGFNITDEALENSSAKMIPADTIVVATRMGLGKVVRPQMPVAINQDLKALFPSKALDKDFLEHWLISQGSNIEAMGTGTTVKGIRLNQIKELDAPLPPLNEQRRIVEKIETLFARLDKGEEAVREVRTLLKRYRQSVLKAAVTGALTADWRAERAGRLEHGQDLLARILKARKENWQGRGKYKAPVEPDTRDLPELPEGWVWASVDQVTSFFGNGLSRKPVAEQTDFPILRISATRALKIHLDDIRYYRPKDGEDLTKYWVEKDDLLFTRYNGSGHLVGVCGLMRSDERVLHPDKLIKARPVAIEDLGPEYLELAWNSGATRSFIADHIKTTSGQQGIAGSDIKIAPFPLPSLAEQRVISERLWEAFDKAEKIEALCETELKRSASLRQSILKDAFAGRLVPQDPADEPASALLERIKAEQSAAPKKTRRKTTA